MLSDEWLSRYGLLENFNASVTRTGTRTRTRTGTGTWTTGVTAIALCTSCSRAKKHLQWLYFTPLLEIYCDSVAVLQGSGVVEWLAHWLLVLEVPGSFPVNGEENLLVQTRFPSCHLQE